jgi:hypothetical protein
MSAVMPPFIEASSPEPMTAGPLLALERQVRGCGTGLQDGDLIGCWQLQRVWSRGSQRADGLSGGLLRALAARLEIGATSEGLRLRNAVNLGGLELRFEGPGRLQGRRPLLLFSFESVELRFGDRLLVQRQLPKPAPRRLPFFALIHRDRSGWLAARGRGGGLALWRLQASPAAAVATMDSHAP